MFIHKFILLILAGALLTSCGGKQSLSRKLIRNIDEKILTECKLPHGNIIAAYDLAKFELKKSKRIYSSDYALIVNNEKYNSQFINKLKRRQKSKKTIWAEALIKSVRIKDLTMKLHNKYGFLNSAEIGLFRAKISNVGNNLNELVKLDKIFSSIPLMLPSHVPYVSSQYGMRKHPIKKKRKFHSGIDLVARKSSAIYAAASGIVGKITREKNYGNMLVINHSHNFVTKYAHLKSINVNEGDKVQRGEMVGIQGRTGKVTGEHLHFEIWLNGKHIDPFDFIAHNEI